MDVQTGQSGNVDLSIARYVEAINALIETSDYIFITSESDISGIICSGMICRMLMQYRKGFHVRWLGRDSHTIQLSTESDTQLLHFPLNVPPPAAIYHSLKTIDGRYVNNAGLAIAGCMHEQRSPAVSSIIEEARRHNVIDVVQGAKFYFDDIKESVLYSTNPVFDISGNAGAVDDFLTSIGVSGNIHSLTKQKKSQLLSLLILKSIDQDETKLVGDVIILNYELIPTAHRFATTIDACGDEPSLALSLCLKDINGLSRAKKKLINYNLQIIENVRCQSTIAH